MDKERGLFINSLGARFTELLRKADNDGSLDIGNITSTTDLIGHPLEMPFAEAIQAALDKGFTGFEIGLVFAHCINTLLDEEEDAD